ncbi:tryptophan synthase subunit alpha [Caproicibacter fermentans]|uniref:Tryptophan synthase alpha chain n=1 Tax=Caproicibacter fermentans TaxID=2576756 RepID=A0A7G8TB56_9FIRM|nr:tryptophan synthase subunit alpha [Caproicibacter fermentans]QNK40847.1 tryptophan synthase subunit alpha [Caproicibacter fermentans]
MNRIDRKFAQLKEKGEKALIPFVTAGDPNLETTEKLVLAMFSAGADLVEIGVPFSDPVAEGPVIQKASSRALNSGTTLMKIFGLVKKLREKTDEPILFMLYLNSIFRFGKERFFGLCSASGVDGVIVPDMPFEERDEILGTAEKYGVISISMVAPTSHERIAMIASSAKGFLYCVSSTGVTGTRNRFTTDFDAFFGAIHRAAKVPCAVGFGISDPEQAKRMASYCDGVIVGSAVVKIVEREGENSVIPAADFVKSLCGAVKGVKSES